VHPAAEYSVATPGLARLAVDMHIEQLDLADTRRIRACHEALLAVQRVGEPEGPWLTGHAFGGWLTVGWGGDPREAWLVPGPDGSVAGWYRLRLPDRENPDQANLDLVVHPAERRHGIGLALLRHAASRAAAHRRTVLCGMARNGSPGESFARSAGAEPGLAEVKRVQDLAQVGKDKLDQLRGPAERAAAGYSLVSWIGPVPEEFIEQAAGVYGAMSDAPQDPGTAPEVWDARRVRERVNDLRPHFGMRDYTVAARHADTGEMAGLTEIAVDPEDPGWGYQQFTVVTRKHRGHRLGLLLKIAMLQLLASTEPQLERIVTWNAQVNDHMIAVNEALGYTVTGPLETNYRVDVAALLGSPEPGKA
jgi:GNAT superfamily N-acetyltransferase